MNNNLVLLALLCLTPYEVNAYNTVVADCHAHPAVPLTASPSHAVQSVMTQYHYIAQLNAPMRLTTITTAYDNTGKQQIGTHPG